MRLHTVNGSGAGFTLGPLGGPVPRTQTFKTTTTTTKPGLAGAEPQDRVPDVVIITPRAGGAHLMKHSLLVKTVTGVPVVAQWLTNPTRNYEVSGSIPDLTQWVKDPVLPELWCSLQMRLGSRVAIAMV